MRNQFHSWDDVQNNGFIDRYMSSLRAYQDHTLKPTGLETAIFSEMLADDGELRDITRKNQCKIPQFKGLVQDVFTALFSASLRYNEPEELFTHTGTINKKVIEELIKSEEYLSLKFLCERKEMPAFQACKAFCESIGGQMPALTGELDKYIQVLDMLRDQNFDLFTYLSKFKDRFSAGLPVPLQKRALFIANKAEKKQRQMEDIWQKIQEMLIWHTLSFQKAVSKAAKEAVEKAAETSVMLMAWGDGSGEMQNNSANRDILKKAKENKELQDIARMLGRYREILARKRKNSYAYGLGEKYDIIGGNDLNLCLSSEMALLGTVETQTLFLDRYHKRSLRQYRKRDAIIKGEGDIIICVDESISMTSIIHWAKALALALHEIAMKGKRKFAMIHFASKNQIKVDIFIPGQYTTDDILKAAQHFWAGNTDFEAPLAKAVKLLHNGFEKADITFITDGKCKISDQFAKDFNLEKAMQKCTVTGILLNEGNLGTGKSLIPFCDEVYKTSDLSTDEIALQIIGQRG